MIVLGFDTETSGLNVAEDRIIEVGAILYDTDTKAPLMVYNTMIRPLDPLPAGYVSPTGINGEWLTKYGIHLPDAFGEIQRMIAAMDEPIIVAHNGTNFDKPLSIAELHRHRIIGHGLEEAHWVDSRLDLPFKAEPTSRRLVHLAAEHGFCNPFEHRAIFDVCTMLKIIDQYDFSEILELSKIPTITIRALTNYEQRQLAKDARFQWDSEKKLWSKQIRVNALEREVAAAAEKGFSIVAL